MALKFAIEVDDKGTAKIKNLQAGIKQTAKASKGLNSQLLKMAGAVAGIATLGRAFSSVAKTGAEFEKGMSQVKAILNPTAQDFKALEKEARNLGATTAFSAKEASQAFVELGKLGLSTNEILASSADVLNLAAASGVEMAQAAEATAITLAQYEMSADEAGRVTDVMAKSFVSSALDMEKFQESMKFVGPVAKGVGISLEGTTNELAKLADAGISGSQAGTGLRRIFIEMNTEGSKVNKFLEKVAPNAQTFNEKMVALKNAGVSTGDVFNLFGKIAGTSAQVLINGADSATKFEKALGDAGLTAEAMAKKQLDNVLGKMDILRSTASELALSLFDSFGPIITEAIELVTEKIAHMAEWVKENQTEIRFFGEMALAAFRGIVEFLDRAASFIKGTFNGVASAITFVFGSALDIIQDTINGVIKGLNYLREAIGKDPIELINIGAKETLAASKELGESAAKNFTEAFLGAERQLAKARKKKAGTGPVKIRKQAAAGESVLPAAGAVADSVAKPADKLAAEKERLRKEDLKASIELAKLKAQGNVEATIAALEMERDFKLAHETETENQKLLVKQQFIQQEAALREQARQAEMANLQTHLANVSQAFSIGSQTLGALQEAEQNRVNARFDQRQQRIREEAQQQLAAAQGNASAQEAIRKRMDDKLAALDLQREKQQQAAARRLATIRKGVATGEAIINGAVAFTKALTAGPIAGPILASLIAAQTAAQVGLIQTQSFARGGFPEGRNTLVRVNENGQESVLNPNATRFLGTEAINDLNRGRTDTLLERIADNTGAGGQGKSVQINIQGGMVDQRFIEDQLLPAMESAAARI